MSGNSVEEVRARFKAHFSVPTTEHGKQWSALWDASDIPWDRGLPSPALVDLFTSTNSPASASPHPPATTALQHLQAAQRPKRALVPGCGRGYDVAFLSTFGFDAYGLDISTTAIDLARKFHQENPPPSTGSAGSISFLCGDFFKNDWVHPLLHAGENIDDGAFDVAYDYTFLCALEPSMRKDWARRMKELLRKGEGVLVCLEFPLFKDLESGGPPWALRSEFYDELLGGEEGGFVLVERFSPARTHAIGMGTDRVSVWRRK